MTLGLEQLNYIDAQITANTDLTANELKVLVEEKFGIKLDRSTVSR